MKLSQSGPSANSGRLTMFYRCDEAHSGLDNVAFLSADKIAFVEDAGDTLHGQRNALDSAFAWDVHVNYGKPGTMPVRWLAEGRDSAATIDAANGGFGTNEGDNEITGLIVSNGATGVGGILGTTAPKWPAKGWRWFYTQQHGDNSTYEVLPKQLRQLAGAQSVSSRRGGLPGRRGVLSGAF